MAFEAMVRDDYKSASVTAFGGREFVKGQWREVPAGQEGSAGAHPFLELREVGGKVAEAKGKPVLEVVPEDAPPAPPPTQGKDVPTEAAPPAPRRGKSS